MTEKEKQELGFTYTIQRRKRKSYEIKVKPTGEVEVAYPWNGRLEEAENMLWERREWVRKHLEKNQKKTPLYKEELKWNQGDEEYFCYLVDRIFPAFQEYKIPYPKIGFRYMKAKWGYCMKGEKRIVLNKMLKLVPKECQEYVIYHELAHFVEANHSRNFYGVLDHVNTAHRAQEKQLRNYYITAKNG